MNADEPDILRWNDMILVGRVGRTHGLRGQVFVNPETDFPDVRFEPGAVVYWQESGQPRALRVETCRIHRGRAIVGFEGIETIDDAEELNGEELRIPAEWLEQLPADSYYVHDLVGCRVQTPAGQTLGVVERVEGEGEAARLVVEGEHGEVLVPLAADICRAVDVVGKQVVVEPPEGLIELNAARPRADSGRSRRWVPRRVPRVPPRGSR